MDELIEQFFAFDEVNDWPSALEVGEHAVAAHPHDARAWAIRARAHMKLENNPACEADLAKALTLDPDDGLALATQAARVGDESGPAEAIRMLDAAIARARPHAMLHIARGWQYDLQSQPQKALADYQRAAEIEPANSRAYSNAAGVLEQLGQPEAAVDLWEQGASRAPQSGMLAYNAGTALYQAGAYERAIVHLDRARKLMGESNMVQMNRALTLQKLGRHHDAIAEWRSLEAREPDWDWVLKGMGRSYYQLNDQRQAQAYFNRLDQVSEDDREGTLAYGWLLYHDRRSEELVAFIAPHAGKEPLRPEFGQMMGTSLWRLDRNDEAKSWLERTVSADPDYHYARADLANVLSQTFGQHQEALRHIEQAISQAPDTDFYQRLREEITAREQSDHAPASKGWIRRLLGRD